MKLLVIDDNKETTTMLSKFFDAKGLTTVVTNDPMEGLKHIREDHFDVILLDIMMPIMDGNEATQIIRTMNNYKKIPIIALTAKTMPEDRELALKSGASEYLTKPIDFDKLVSILRIWLFKKD